MYSKLMSDNQVKYNGFLIAFGFLLGAINVLFLYTRVFTPQAYGTLSFILASATLVFPLISLGVQQTIIRFYEANDENGRKALMANSLQLLVLVSILVFALVYAFEFELRSVLEAKNSLSRTALFSMAAVAISMAFFELLFSWAKVNYRSTGGIFLKEVFPRLVITIVLSTSYWLTPLSLEGFIQILIAVYVIRAFLMGLWSYRLLPFHFFYGLDLHQRIAYLRYGTLVVVGSGLSMAFLEIDKVMLHSFRNASEVALYAVIVFIATTIAIPFRAVQPVFNAKSAKFLAHGQRQQLNTLVQKAVEISLVLGVFIVALLLVAEPLMLSFLPIAYHEAFAIFPIVLVLKIMDSAFSPAGIIFQYTRYYRWYLLISSLFLVSMIFLNLWMIPQYGIYGAALTSFIAVSLFSAVKVGLAYMILEVQALSRSHFWPGVLVVFLMAVEFIQDSTLSTIFYLIGFVLSVILLIRYKVFVKSFLCL
ncbi:MAG: oligosaccharide flippase family protein [Flavobacteriaceae bacterium]